jgi:predicted DNA-binding transcriptional regulator AlpA
MNDSRFKINHFPKVGFVRLKQIIGDPKENPPLPAVVPVSRSTWWAGVKSGLFPRAIKLGPRTTVWRAEDILNFIEQKTIASSGDIATDNEEE